jgi:tetratricopeptide (TPR) repeat protein
LAKGGINFPRLEVPRRHALKAIALNPAYCEGYFALAMTLEHLRDMAPRLKVVEAGLRAIPDCPELRSNYGLMLFKAGYGKAGLAASLAAQQIDPVSPWIGDNLVRRLLATGQTQRAFEVQAVIERLKPGNHLHETQRLRMMGERGEPRAALALFEKKTRESGYPPSVPALWLPVLRWRIDPASLDLEAMDRIAAQDISLEPDAAYGVAAQFARVGQIERAFTILEDAPSDSFGNYTTLFWPEAAPLRRDPRFFRLMHRLGLVKVWQERGKWPDFCSEPGLTYDCAAQARLLERAASAGAG